MRLEPIASVPGMGRSLIAHDPASRGFPARGALFPEEGELRSRVHRRGQAYDQGQTGTCVPHAGKGLLNSEPFSAWAPYARRFRYDPFGWYPEIQRRDEWPGESPEYEGTSGLALCKWLQELGLIGGYRWNFSLEDTLRTVSFYGPVAVGSWFREGMMSPGPDGRVTYSGRYVGGHEWELMGVDVEREEVIAMNSWGSLWGARGRFRLAFSELGRLLDDDGDSVTFLPPAGLAG